VSSPTTRGGCRWYEIRNIASGTPVVFQQGTYAPDGAWRWMGTTCQDKAGNMGLAFSYSSPTISPGMAYTGRLAGDGAGLMTQGETVSQAGTGYQTVNRWGDYASMNIDPNDGKCAWCLASWKKKSVRVCTCVFYERQGVGNQTRES
jgi:hypothetical protein